jgi:hypothetical protein
MHDDKTAAPDNEIHYTLQHPASIGELGMNVAGLALSDYRVPPKSEDRQLRTLIKLTHTLTLFTKKPDQPISHKYYDCLVIETRHDDR